MQENENPTKDLKLYSKRAIGGATFLGGPIAAGYLIRENYQELKEPDKGRQVFIYSLVFTFVLFGGMFLIPENILDSIPNLLIPIIYTALISLYVERIQGKILDKHKVLGNAFQSGWKAAGIGFVSLLIIGLVLIGFFFLSPMNKALEKYDENVELFSKNETVSLRFYEIWGQENDIQSLDELNQSTIPKWKENIRLITENNAIDDLPKDLKTETELLLKYAQLRLETFETFKKALEGTFEDHEPRLNILHIEIDLVLKKLNSL